MSSAVPLPTWRWRKSLILSAVNYDVTHACTSGVGVGHTVPKYNQRVVRMRCAISHVNVVVER